MAGDRESYEAALVAFERAYLGRMLELNFWNVKRTAIAIRLPLSTLKYKMQRLDLRRPMTAEWRAGDEALHH